MKIFFDTEFTGLRKETTLISLGMIAENGDTFYAEFIDYDESQCDDWIKENVIDNLLANSTKGMVAAMVEVDNYHLGTKSQIASRLKQWINKFDTDSIELVSDCCHYDMVLLIDLFGTAFDIPSRLCPVCYDINQDIARYYNITQKEAFDLNREEILKEHNVSITTNHLFDSMLMKGENYKLKHNALWDATVIKDIYFLLNQKEV